MILFGFSLIVISLFIAFFIEKFKEKKLKDFMVMWATILLFAGILILLINKK